jgi:hypothetical protein
LTNVIGSSTVQQAIRAVVLIHLEVISSVAHLRRASPVAHLPRGTVQNVLLFFPAARGWERRRLQETPDFLAVDK